MTDRERAVVEALREAEFFLSHTGNHRALVGDNFAKPSVRYELLKSTAAKCKAALAAYDTPQPETLITDHKFTRGPFGDGVCAWDVPAGQDAWSSCGQPASAHSTHDTPQPPAEQEGGKVEVDVEAIEKRALADRGYPYDQTTDAEDVLALLAEVSALREERSELREKLRCIDGWMPCVECGASLPVSHLVPASAHPESPQICRGCQLEPINEDLTDLLAKAEDALGVADTRATTAEAELAALRAENERLSKVGSPESIQVCNTQNRQTSQASAKSATSRHSEAATDAASESAAIAPPTTPSEPTATLPSSGSRANRDEYAWLIEYTGSGVGPPSCFSGRDSHWGPMADAVRFSRKEDAEKVARFAGLNLWRAVEHAWIPLRAAQPGQEQPDTRPELWNQMRAAIGRSEGR